MVNKKEVYYTWKEFKIPEGENKPRFLTPWADPMLFETPFDYLFDTVKEAKQSLVDFIVDPEESKEWVLVKITMEEVINEKI